MEGPIIRFVVQNEVIILLVNNSRLQLMINQSVLLACVFKPFCQTALAHLITLKESYAIRTL